MSRRAFTLVELIAVIAVVLVLLTLSLLVTRSFMQGKAERQGTIQIQGALNRAKSRAMAEQHPCGVRFFFDTWVCNKIEDIEQPDSLGSNFGSPIAYTVTVDAASLNTVTIDGGMNTSIISVGDHIQFHGGLAHYITQINGNQLVINSPALAPVDKSTDFLITRAPKPTAGSTVLLMADAAVVDFQTNQTYNTLWPGVFFAGGPSNGQADIVFAPSGRVLNAGNSTAIYLWVRDNYADDARRGQPTIVAIQVNTGQVSAHPVAPGADPYEFARPTIHKPTED